MAIKKEPKAIVQCRDCQFATLMRNGNNPIISVCAKKNGERFVGTCLFHCPLFKQRIGPEVWVDFIPAK